MQTSHYQGSHTQVSSFCCLSSPLAPLKEHIHFGQHSLQQNTRRLKPALQHIEAIWSLRYQVKIEVQLISPKVLSGEHLFFIKSISWCMSIQLCEDGDVFCTTIPISRLITQTQAWTRPLTVTREFFFSFFLFPTEGLRQPKTKVHRYWIHNCCKASNCFK